MAPGRKGQVVKSFELAPLPDVPLVDETLQILNEQTWPSSLNMYYGQPPDEKGSPADALSLWRYLTAADVQQYAERLRRYNAIVADHSYSERKALPKSMELLNYLTANGWPEYFLYTKTELSKSEHLLTLDFKVNQPSFVVEVAIIENASAKPITINQLFGQPAGGNKLRAASALRSTTGKQLLPSEPVTLTPSSRLVVPLRLVFAAEAPDGFGRATSEAEQRKQSDESFRKLMARPQGTVFRTELYSALRGNTRGKDNTYVIRKVRETYKPPSYPIRSDLEIARRALPNDPRLFELTGFILRRRGQQEEGLQNLQRAVELDPRNFFTLQQIAISYENLGRYARGNRCAGSRVSDRARQRRNAGRS